MEPPTEPKTAHPTGRSHKPARRGRLLHGQQAAAAAMTSDLRTALARPWRSMPLARADMPWATGSPIGATIRGGVVGRGRHGVLLHHGLTRRLLRAGVAPAPWASRLS